MTRNGGRWPVESPDGKLVYYLKGEGDRSGVWQVPVAGGEETQAIESVRRQASFAVADNGIYFFPIGVAEVRLFDFKTRATRTVASFERFSGRHDLAVSTDGRTILYAQQDSAGSDLMLVENFR